MWAQLGEVVFDILTAPDSFEGSNSWDYAEHKVVGGKPKLQSTGQGLEELNLGYSLHVSYADPKASLDRFKEAAGKKEPLALMMGSGEYRGRYVITALSETYGHTAPDGRILSISGRLTLKEHVGQTAAPLGEAQILAGESPAVAVKALADAAPENGVKPWVNPNLVDDAQEIESSLHDLDITPVEWPDARNVLEKGSELSGWKSSTFIKGVTEVSKAAAGIGATGVNGLVTSAAGLLTAGMTTRDPSQAVGMTKGFLSSVPTTAIWQTVQPSLQGDFFGTAATATKKLAGTRLDTLAQHFPTREAEQMARTLVTRLPVYTKLRGTLLEAANRESPVPRDLFAQGRSFSWMRDQVRFPTS